MPIPKTRQKLINLFYTIEDESIKNIIATTIKIENENRESPKFPIRKILDVIDAEANLKEKEEGRN
jgi:hypothetical protein